MELGPDPYPGSYHKGATEYSFGVAKLIEVDSRLVPEMPSPQKTTKSQHECEIPIPTSLNCKS